MSNKYLEKIAGPLSSSIKDMLPVKSLSRIAKNSFAGKKSLLRGIKGDLEIVNKQRAFKDSFARQ